MREPVTEPISPARKAPATPPPKPNALVGPAILLVWLALGAWLVAQPNRLAVFAFVMVGWILSVMVHEFSHAATAWLGGDRVGEAREAIQRGRRIATLRRSAGLAVPVALISPPPPRG